MTSTVPSGTEPLSIATQALVPGYYQLVPPGQKPFVYRSASGWLWIETAGHDGFQVNQARRTLSDRA